MIGGRDDALVPIGGSGIIRGGDAWRNRITVRKDEGTQA